MTTDMINREILIDDWITFIRSELNGYHLYLGQVNKVYDKGGVSVVVKFIDGKLSDLKKRELPQP